MEPTVIKTVFRRRDGVVTRVEDTLVVEEPLEVRVNNEPFTVTMRTPGADFDLVRGLLLTEGAIRDRSEIGSIRYCDVAETDNTGAENIVTVRLTHAVGERQRWQRTLMAGSSCGLCGKAAIEALASADVPAISQAPFPLATLQRLPPLLRSRQILFDATGGLHAAAIFKASGECIAFFEDIGRHNATDKAIGRGVLDGILPWNDPAESLVLLVSGRASFEIVQKALMAGIGVVASVSAASALAVDLAETSGQALVGFLRGADMTVYTGANRLA